MWNAHNYCITFQNALLYIWRTLFMIRVGIDLGCDHLRLVTQEEGLIFDEPCMVALDKKGHVMAIGNDAKELNDSLNQNITVISPLASSSIDFDALHALLEQVCYDYHVFGLFKKTILLVSYPTNLSQEQCDELKEHLLDLGASRVYFDEEIWIAAIGARLDLFSPVANCVMNIGSSNCDIATFASGKMIQKAECKISGTQVNLMISKWLRYTYKMNVSPETIEEIKNSIGQTIKQENPKTIIIQGLDLNTHQVKTVELNENMLVDVLYPLCQQWANWIIHFLSTLTKEQQEDIYMRGIIACGGTMLLGGLKENLRLLLPCPIYTTDDPLNTVSQGLEALLSKMD